MGTSRFSVVLMPERTTSAPARGMAACRSRWRTGMGCPLGDFSRIRSHTSAVSVTQALIPPPSTTHRQERSASFPAHRNRLSSVTTMEHSCSATSTAARVPMRLAAVKYPLITPLRHTAGKNTANSRREGITCTFPIQWVAIRGAPRNSPAATVPLQRML